MSARSRSSIPPSLEASPRPSRCRTVYSFERSVQAGFVIKVFSIVLLQLALTTAIAGLMMHVEAVRKFVIGAKG